MRVSLFSSIHAPWTSGPLTQSVVHLTKGAHSTATPLSSLEYDIGKDNLDNFALVLPQWPAWTS